MSIRNRIAKLARKGMLNYAQVYPGQQAVEAQRHYNDILGSLADPEIYDFLWRDSEIWIDEDELVHYPRARAEVLHGAALFPVPHEYVWIETAVADPFGAADRIYNWDVKRTEYGYAATPVLFLTQNRMLAFLGQVFEFHATGEKDGTFRFIDRFAGANRQLDHEEIEAQALTLAHFFRMLCAPKTEIVTERPNERENAKRALRGHAPLAPRSIVKLGLTQYPVSTGNRERGHHSSPRPHNRRAHIRRLRNGRIVQVRDCSVGLGRSVKRPPPQTFEVDNRVDQGPEE